MKKLYIFILIAFIQVVKLNAQTWKIYLTGGSNPTCSGAAITLLVADATNINNWYSSTANGRYIEWHDNNSCTGTIAYAPGPGSNAWFLNVPNVGSTQTFTYNAKLSTGQCLTYTITVNPNPSTAGTIVGQNTVCKGQANVSYSVPAISNATTYTWTYSGTGATISGTTNPMTINFSPSATNGVLKVKGVNSCSVSVSSPNFSITVTPSPSVTINAVSSTTFCQGDSVILNSTTTNNLWNTSATTQSIVVYNSGSYNTVTTNSIGCTATSNTINTSVISPPPTPTISMGGVTISSSNISGNQWYLNGSIISGATSQTYSVTQNGIYTVVTTVNGCSSNSAPFNYIYTSINSTVKTQSDILIYPNPASSKFNIKNISDLTTIKIYNSLGQTVYKSIDSKDVEILTSEFDNGIYIITLESQSRPMFKSKIIVNKK